MRYNTAIDFRDYVILNSDIAGQNVVRVTAALFLGKDCKLISIFTSHEMWLNKIVFISGQDGSQLIETTITEQFKASVQIPSGAIIKKSIKVSGEIKHSHINISCQMNKTKSPVTPTASESVWLQ